MKQLLLLLAAVALLGSTMYMLQPKSQNNKLGVPYEVIAKYLMWKH
jgi:hypothetical protein